MKKELLTLALFFTAFSPSLGQSKSMFNLDFDSQSGLQNLMIDTGSNQNNIWQIGKPLKSVFTSASSSPNVLVTDSLNVYPINDTSVFYITDVASYDFGWSPHRYQLSGEYFVNSDTLTDYGKIELSPDSGSTWFDLLNDTINSWYWNNKPVLTGNSYGWKQFQLDLTQLGGILGISQGQTIIYRFSFISDSLQTNKDGLMFDNFNFVDWLESVDEAQLNFISSNCFPNPADKTLTISFSNDKLNPFEVLIYDITGKVIFSSHTRSDTADIPVKGLSNGMYFYKLVNRNTREYSIGKFVKE